MRKTLYIFLGFLSLALGLTLSPAQRHAQTRKNLCHTSHLGDDWPVHAPPSPTHIKVGGCRISNVGNSSHLVVGS